MTVNTLARGELTRAFLDGHFPRTWRTFHRAVAFLVKLRRAQPGYIVLSKERISLMSETASSRSAAATRRRTPSPPMPPQKLHAPSSRRARPRAPHPPAVRARRVAAAVIPARPNRNRRG